MTHTRFRAIEQIGFQSVASGDVRTRYGHRRVTFDNEQLKKKNNDL